VFRETGDESERHHGFDSARVCQWLMCTCEALCQSDCVEAADFLQMSRDRRAASSLISSHCLRILRVTHLMASVSSRCLLHLIAKCLVAPPCVTHLVASVSSRCFLTTWQLGSSGILGQSSNETLPVSRSIAISASKPGFGKHNLHGTFRRSGQDKTIRRREIWPLWAQSSCFRV
jgi:hypothetical protein